MHADALGPELIGEIAHGTLSNGGRARTAIRATRIPGAGVAATGGRDGEAAASPSRFAGAAIVFSALTGDFSVIRRFAAGAIAVTSEVFAALAPICRALLKAFALTTKILVERACLIFVLTGDLRMSMIP